MAHGFFGACVKHLYGEKCFVLLLFLFGADRLKTLPRLAVLHRKIKK